MSDISDVRKEIVEAFADVPYPGDDLVTPTYDDEGVTDYFAGRKRGDRDTTVRDLRRHDVALIFFNDDAFRYWLPEFMLAELEDPDTADMIAEGIASQFDRPRGTGRLEALDEPELRAVVSFLRCCSARYPAVLEFDEDEFEEAAKAVERYLLYLAGQD